MRNLRKLARSQKIQEVWAYLLWYCLKHQIAQLRFRQNKHDMRIFVKNGTDSWELCPGPVYLGLGVTAALKQKARLRLTSGIAQEGMFRIRLGDTGVSYRFRVRTKPAQGSEHVVVEITLADPKRHCVGCGKRREVLEIKAPVYCAGKKVKGNKSSVQLCAQCRAALGPLLKILDQYSGPRRGVFKNRRAPLPLQEDSEI